MAQIGKPAENVVIQNSIDDIRLIEQITKEDRIAEAIILLNNIEKVIADLGLNAQTVVNNYLSKSATIAELRQSGGQILEILDLLRGKTNWNPWNSKLGPHQDVSLFLHSSEPEGQYHFKTEGYLRNVNIMDAAAAILENDLHRYWIPMCTNSKVVETLTPYRRKLQAKFDFVLLKKTATLEARGDVLPDGSLLLTFRPVTHGASEDRKSGLPKVSKDSMDFWGGILLQDIDILEDTPRNEFQDLIDFIEVRRQQIPSHTSDGIKRKLIFDDDASVVSGARPSFDAGRMSSADSADDGNGGFEEENGKKDQTFRTPEKRQGNSSEEQKMQPGTPWTEAEQAELGIVPKPANKTAVIKVQAVFMADLKIDFIPDWIFNLGMRSTTSMFIPMLEQQALLFGPNGLHREAKQQHTDFYEAIESRLRDYTHRK